MNKLAMILVSLVAVSCSQPSKPASVSAPTPSAACAPPTSVSVHFSPKGGCTDTVVSLAGSARKTIRLEAYGFTSMPIADAMCAAVARGVSVEVVLDRSNATDKYSQMSKLTACGVKAYLDSKHPIHHNKVVVVDSSVVETGSFNFTGAAESSNAENCLVIMDAPLAAQYEGNWQVHMTHSVLQ